MSQAPLMQPPEMPDFHEPPRWPKTVGIISIVWASIGLVCGACGLGQIALMPMFTKMAEKDFGPMPAVMKPGPAQMILMVVGTAWAVLLLIAGISTVSRRARGRPLHLLYGAGSVLISVPALALGYMQTKAMAEWVAANPGDKWAQNAHPEFGYIGIAVGAVLGLAWPLFCLVWFASHRPEVGAPPADLV